VKILNLSGGGRLYTCNVYLVTGTRNTMEDVNTLVDVGADPAVIARIGEAGTGVGKKQVEKVVLTHNHHDHANLLPRIREAFDPEVYAFSLSLEGVDHVLKDGDALKLGDRMFEVMHAPGHSSDSICLYCEGDGILFAGDTPVVVNSSDGSHEKGYVRVLERLCRRDVRTVYPGHGAPLLQDCNARMRASLKNVRESRAVACGSARGSA